MPLKQERYRTHGICFTFCTGGESSQMTAALKSHKWTDTQLDNDEFVIRLADAVTSTVWVTSLGLDGMGDRVSRGLPQVQIEGLDSILNVNRFLSRKSEVEARLLAEHEKQILARFNEGMQRREEEQRRRGEQTNFPREGHETNNEDVDIDDELQQ